MTVFHFFDSTYFLFLIPPMLLAFWAQYRVKSTYAEASRQPARLTGAAAARHVLDSAGLHDVAIEQIPGELSDHYDPRSKVLRLSPGVYGQRTLAAVGIAAHEAGHAIQDARNYVPLVVRNAAVPVANFGGGFGGMLAMLGIMMNFQPLLLVGILVFSGVVFFQVVNLPIEFDASSRAKKELVALGIVPQAEMLPVERVLSAAALTYVAGTLQSIMMLAYYILRYSGGSRN
jgi:Zn-dependent membrane protease YugP